MSGTFDEESLAVYGCNPPISCLISTPFPCRKVPVFDVFFRQTTPILSRLPNTTCSCFCWRGSAWSASLVRARFLSLGWFPIPHASSSWSCTERAVVSKDILTKVKQDNTFNHLLIYGSTSWPCYYGADLGQSRFSNKCGERTHQALPSWRVETEEACPA